MARTRSPQPIKVFWPNVGSIKDYPQSTFEILAHIRRARPDRHYAINWLCSKYRVVPEFARKLLNVFEAVGLVESDKSAYSIAAAGGDYLTAGDPDVLFRLFTDRARGFKEMFQVLESTAPISLKGLDSNWREQMRPVAFASNQGPIRYNWLRGFGYASVVARQIFLTERGLKFASELRVRRADTREGILQISHADLEDKIRMIGEFFEFEAKRRASVNEALPTYAVKLRQGDRQLDCLWVRYVPFAGQVKFPVEIQLGGSLADSLDRLETVSHYVQNAIVVTTEDQEEQIIDRLRVKKSPLLDKLTIIFVEDVYKAVEATTVLTALAKKIFPR